LITKGQQMRAVVRYEPRQQAPMVAAFCFYNASMMASAISWVPTAVGSSRVGLRS